MHTHTLERWQHAHRFSSTNEKGERRTYYVLALTAATMLVEIITGTLFGSMALLADGWHMGTHVAAFLITLFAYRHARRHADDPAYAFGTGKVGVLGGFSSAIALAVVAVVMMVESILRLISPHEIQFDAAIGVAVIGLAVNVISAFLLKDDHHHHHHHHHDDGAEHHHGDGHHHDHNLRAAYLHVLADALTSLLAIVALLSGKYFGWSWMDALMGIVGAVIITHWAYGLLRQTAPILLDAGIDPACIAEIRERVESDRDNRISDLHVWRVSAHHHAVILSIVTHDPRPVEHYKKLLEGVNGLAHITVEVHHCDGPSCVTFHSSTA